MQRRASEPKIRFPWEGRRGLIRALGLGRLRPFLLVAALLGALLLIGLHERQRAGVRQTRATLIDARRAVDLYLATHDGGCPSSLAEAAELERLDGEPRDAWGRPLRLVCPSRFEGMAYELMSDGPDGNPGGLDRIE